MARAVPPCATPPFRYVAESTLCTRVAGATLCTRVAGGGGCHRLALVVVAPYQPWHTCCSRCSNPRCKRGGLAAIRCKCYAPSTVRCACARAFFQALEGLTPRIEKLSLKNLDPAPDQNHKSRRGGIVKEAECYPGVANVLRTRGNGSRGTKKWPLCSQTRRNSWRSATPSQTAAAAAAASAPPRLPAAFYSTIPSWVFLVQLY
jgi:hypothetical protein